MRQTLALSVSLSLVTSSLIARSDDLELKVRPVLGDQAHATGWCEILTSTKNNGGATTRAALELTHETFGLNAAFNSRAELNAPPGKTTFTRMATFEPPGYSAQIKVTVKRASHDLEETTTLSTERLPLLLDLHSPARLGVALRGRPLPARWNPSSTPAKGLELGLATVDIEPATGDPLLPTFAASYADVTAIVAPSNVFVGLDEGPRRALTDWVIAGGTLALALTRAEDLRHPAMEALAGGNISEGPAPSILETLPTLPRSRTGSGTLSGTPIPGAPMYWNRDNEDSPFLPIRTDGVRRAAPRGPSSGLAASLKGYTGGRLVPSVSGATAPYGLGEVHFLPVDPGATPYVDDPWVRSMVVELLARAWDRRVAFVTHMGTAGTENMSDLRRVLDPNQSFQIPLAIATLLLILYSVIAGPVAFRRALRLGRPLAPLKWVPILSLAVFVSIVVTGLAAKGWRGRARRIALVEARAGFPRGAVRRLRGLFSSDAHSMTVTTEDSAHVLRPVFEHSLEPATGESVLVMKRDGVELTGIRTRPWKTTVIVEEGLQELGGTVDFTLEHGQTQIKNALRVPIEHALVHVPGDAIRYFAQLPAGAIVNVSTGEGRAFPTARSSVGPVKIHGFGSPFPVGTSDTTQALADLWNAFESTAVDYDWWPENLPVLMGELVGVPPRPTDTNMRVESDRLLVRILGTL